MSLFGQKPMELVCPSCKKNVTTYINPKATVKTHIFAILLAFACLWPCACGLYCTQCTRDAEHYCPNCAALLGIYER